MMGGPITGTAFRSAESSLEAQGALRSRSNSMLEKLLPLPAAGNREK